MENGSFDSYLNLVNTIFPPIYLRQKRMVESNPDENIRDFVNSFSKLYNLPARVVDFILSLRSQNEDEILLIVLESKRIPMISCDEVTSGISIYQQYMQPYHIPPDNNSIYWRQTAHNSFFPK